MSATAPPVNLVRQGYEAMRQLQTSQRQSSAGFHGGPPRRHSSPEGATNRKPQSTFMHGPMHESSRACTTQCGNPVAGRHCSSVADLPVAICAEC